MFVYELSGFGLESRCSHSRENILETFMSSSSLTKKIKILLEGLSTLYHQNINFWLLPNISKEFPLNFRPENVSSKQKKTNKQKRKNSHWNYFYNL